jgi:hypothetical protein
MLADADLRAGLVLAGHELVRTRYAMDVVAATWTDLYGRAAAAPRPDGAA